MTTGETDIEKPVEPIKVYSEKELVREFEKIASTLVPEKDWSLRIAAMQRVEGLVIGGQSNSILFTTFLIMPLVDTEICLFLQRHMLFIHASTWLYVCVVDVKDLL